MEHGFGMKKGFNSLGDSQKKTILSFHPTTEKVTLKVFVDLKVEIKRNNYWITKTVSITISKVFHKDSDTVSDLNKIPSNLP